jgi:hypothetical protein
MLHLDVDTQGQIGRLYRKCHVIDMLFNAEKRIYVQNPYAIL